MKKLIVIFSILFSVNAVFGQSLKSVKLDSLVNVSLPSSYTKKDTLGQQVYTANSDLGYMIAIRQANEKGNQPLQKENDLNAVLKKYIDGIQSQSGNGSAQNIRDTTIGTLKAKAFTLFQNDPNGESQYRNFILLYTQDATYTFEYGYGDSRKDLIKGESKAYFASIKLSRELQRNDQYVDTRPQTSNNKVTVIEITGGILIIGFIAWLIFRKKDSGQFA
jgi:hypothetical protein